MAKALLAANLLVETDAQHPENAHICATHRGARSQMHCTWGSNNHSNDHRAK